MLTPHVEQVITMANEFNLIPVYKKVLADMETPIRIFRRYAERDRAFLLESVEEANSGRDIHSSVQIRF